MVQSSSPGDHLRQVRLLPRTHELATQSPTSFQPQHHRSARTLSCSIMPPSTRRRKKNPCAPAIPGHSRLERLPIEVSELEVLVKQSAVNNSYCIMSTSSIPAACQYAPKHSSPVSRHLISHWTQRSYTSPLCPRSSGSSSPELAMMSGRPGSCLGRSCGRRRSSRPSSERCIWAVMLS